MQVPMPMMVGVKLVVRRSLATSMVMQFSFAYGASLAAAAEATLGTVLRSVRHLLPFEKSIIRQQGCSKSMSQAADSTAAQFCGVSRYDIDVSEVPTTYSVARSSKVQVTSHASQPLQRCIY